MNKKPLRTILAGLSLTAATLTGALITTGTAAATTPPDTAWGATAPDTTDGDNSTDDTAWGTPPTTPTPTPTPTDPVARPMDTAWG